MTPGRKKLSAGDKARVIAPVILYAALAVAAWKLGYFHTQKVTAAAAGAGGNQWVTISYTLIYAAVAALALPVGPLAYASGAIFGFVRASIIVWIGSMIGAVAGYYLARGVWSKPARRILDGYQEKLHGLRKGSVFLTALRLQLMPIVPFGAFNYAAGIAKLSPFAFFAGTAIGIIPGTLMATFIGDRVAAGVKGGGKAPYLYAVAAALVLLALSFAPPLWKKFRSKG
ncbi:MAG TPA: VTT domain-containing protein [Gemmatimonadaceae bacterium]